ncbi:MAG: transcription-repair coupling factor, partial [Chloroflexota bacterium]|nr:transcription-repair coupling factor [Chloroflexota bacterium]
MRLSGLVPLLDQLEDFRRLVQAARGAGPTAASPGAAVESVERPAGVPPAVVAPVSEIKGEIKGEADGDAESRAPLPPPAALAVVREAAKPYLLAGLHGRSGRPIVLVASDASRAQEWYGDLLTWSAAPERVLHFPAFDALPYEQLPAVAETVATRVGALIQLTGGDVDPPAPAVPAPKGTSSASKDAVSAAKGRRESAAASTAAESVSSGAGSSDAGADQRALPFVIVTSMQALLSMIAPPTEFGGRVLSLRAGARHDMDALIHQLAASGYERVGLVETPGSFSQRGGIVDIFPPLAESPVRLEFFGDEVESIRTFDPATQRSIGDQERFQLAPATELPLWRGAEAAAALRALDWTTLRQEVREEWDWQVRDLGEGAFFAEAPFYARYLLPEPASLLDYLPDALVVLDEPQTIREALEELDGHRRELGQKLTASGSVPVGFQAPYFSCAALAERLTRMATLHLSYRSVVVPVLESRLSAGSQAEREDGSEAEADGRVLTDAGSAAPDAAIGATPDAVPETIVELTSFEMAPTYGGRVKDVIDATRARAVGKQRVVLISQQAARLTELYADRNVAITGRERLDRVPEPGVLTLVHGQLGEGWSNPALAIFLLTDTEVFGWAKPRRVIRRRRIARESFLTELKAGDFVVHIEHGIAQYQGLVRRRTEGGEREYLLLQFAGTDRVYVPTDQLDRVDRYIGVGDNVPGLSKLGGAEWERAKGRVKQSVAEAAKALLELYSAREVAEAYPASPDNEWQRDLEESFPYVETPDQLQAIVDVKHDLESGKPMDRLVCGDVGYGKTEVAVRAAFKAAQDGKQVAVLVPTTILALQHYETFRQRLQAYPVKVELLSRFRSPKEQEAVVEGCVAGTVDIVIGTHRLLGKDVRFKDLGLLVIDEEHRFGVMHKERLKQLRVNVHVLTLTATPIPRTLHTSLVGLRDMSVIETPPEARLPIKTYVTGSNDDLVREAILREVDRGGQVYFVHNRVQSIHQVARKLGRLVPEVDITIGHGQMDEDALEKVMLEFGQGSHDVLVCTTIIESGLDIPNVNTIVINDAGNFGLAQLYQLRGRVGRAGNQAYAYLLYEPNRRLTEAAEKRLRTIFEASDLGAGFKIAMKDLEIRGAGNLLGAEQSGFMNSV